MIGLGENYIDGDSPVKSYTPSGQSAQPGETSMAWGDEQGQWDSWKRKALRSTISLLTVPVSAEDCNLAEPVPVGL